MSKLFPRLLVATEFPPNAPGGGPAVVRQMLKEWPVENLYWWSCLPESDRKFGQVVAGHEIATIPHNLYPHRRWGRPKSWVLENLWTPWAAKHFARALKTIQPQMVWVIPHCWSIPPIANVLPGAGIGFHVSIHDYADCGSFVQLFGGGASGRLLAAADRLYAASTTRDAICQAMVDDLQQRTGRVGNIARAGLEPADFDFLQTPPVTKRGPLRIAYPGSIQVDQSFGLFVAALEQIRNRLPREVSLEFFGNHSYQARPWFNQGWMHEHGNLAAAPLAAELKQCDWGFSPMAMTDEDPRYNRFSLPTKFVSYLGAGLPVISLGHPESSVVKLASAAKVGLCAQTGDVTAMSGQLLTALSDPDPGTTFRESILRCARAGFDSRQMRATLYDCFRKCAQG